MFPYCCLFVVVVFLIFFCTRLSAFTDYYQKSHTRKLLFERYDKILSILDLAKDIAYRKSYQEELLIQASSGYRLNDVEIGELGKKYVKLVLDCCGPATTRDLAEIFGNLDSLCLFLMHGFVSKSIEAEAQLLSIATDENSEEDDLQNALLNSGLKGD